MKLSTVGNLIRDLARQQGSRRALTFPELNADYTFSDLDEISTRVAKTLYRAGFRKGDRFAVWANNLPEWILLQCASAKSVVIVLAVNTGLARVDSVSVQVPLCHCLGCVTGVLGPSAHGPSIVGLTGFHPLRVLECLQNLRCTAMFGVPTMFFAILNHPEFSKFDLSALRKG